MPRIWPERQDTMEDSIGNQLLVALSEGVAGATDAKVLIDFVACRSRVW